MMRISEELRKTSKGKLHYSRELSGNTLKDLYQKCSSPPALSSFHKETPSPKSHQSSSFGLSPSPPPHSETGDNIDGNQSVESVGENEKGECDELETESPSFNRASAQRRNQIKMEKTPLQTPTSPGTSELEEKYLSTQFTHKLRVITDLEREWDNKAKDFLKAKIAQFQKHQQEIESRQQQGLEAVSERRLHDVQSLQSLLEQEQLSRKEISQAVQKLKESHSERLLKQDARLKEVEKLGQQLKEEKEKREQELELKLADIRSRAKSICDTKAALLAALDSCQYKQYLSEAAEKIILLVRKLAEQAEMLATNTDRTGPLDDILLRLKHFQEQSQNALDHVNVLTADAEKKSKAAAEEVEKQKQVEQQKQQASQGQGASAGSRARTASASAASGEEGALDAVLREYEHNNKLLAQVDSALQAFVGNQQMKKLRFDLQRAVNTPVNAISPVNSAHLRDKLLKIRTLLQGQTVEVSGKRINPRDMPEGIMFCKNLTAKMIARKAEEQVSSNHESAFAIAAVAVGLWSDFPDVGELLMAHMQALCPYVLPFMPPRLPQQSSADYHRSLGYKVEDDGTIEPQDKYLKRMSGVMRLYAAILVTAPPQGPNHPHPHGIEHAWIWLTRTMNLKPDPDITATAIFDVLQVTGSFLLRTYRVQFVKLLYALCKLFLPKLKEVAAGSGPVSRLETFLQTTMKSSGMIPQPEGYLSPQFLSSW